MPNVVIAAEGLPPLSLEAPDACALVDLIDASSAPVPFSCRSASCGTCRVVVLEGEAALEPPEDEELDVLDAFGQKPPKYRLACQARLRPGAGPLRLRPVRDDE